MAKMRAKRAKELEILKKYQDDVARRDKLKANDARRDAMDLRDPDDPRYEDVVGSVYGIYEEDEKESLYEELSDELIDAIMEKLTVDMGATLSGWAGRSEESVKHQMELEMAHRRSTEVAEELEALKKAQEELVFENKKLKQSLTDHQSVISSLKESVQDVNLSNARLLYTNRVLRNTSLNERQKDKIVEAISKAGSVEEAKTIHETLQSTVASAPKSRPQSLSEAITRPTSIIRASRKEEPKADPFTTRMRKLAGIE
jgi:FtsZ-binding cell division protein ZapB